MSRKKTFAVAISVAAAVAGLTMVGAGGLSDAAVKPAVMTVAGSLASFAGRTASTGNAPASQRLSIQLWLRPRTAAASRFADVVATPGHSQFHHYLSPDAYAARFGATRSDASQVESWLRAKGFTAVSTDRERSYVSATAAASTIATAFDVQLKLYKPSAAVNAGRYALRSNDRPISLPASLTRIVSGVTGLDNAEPANPVTGPGAGGHTTAGSSPALSSPAMSAPCSSYYGQHLAAGRPAHFGRTAFPTEVCGYSARQLRAAYGADMTNTGEGQTVALVVAGLDPDMLLTLHDYAKVSGLPLPSTKRYAELTVGKGCPEASGRAEPSGAGRQPDSADQPDAEEEMDVEAAYAMAPGAKELVVTGLSCGGSNPEVQGLIDADQAVLDGSGHHPLASIASNSWVGGGEGQPASLTNVEHDFLLQAAAEGVGMYFASGDNSGVETPASDPYAIAVGGTTLGIGTASQRLFETGWSTGLLLEQKGKWRNEGELGAAGGGPSVRWKQPRYQRGVVPAALSRSPGHQGRFRSVPDISADADPATAMAVGVLSTVPGAKPRFILTSGGGTSEATPLVAGLVAAAQQGRRVPFGFLNPVLYKLAGTSALHDIRPITAKTPSLFRATACPRAACGEPGLTIFDDQSISRAAGYTGQVTLKGYDNMTGLGTPSGQQFIKALRALEK